MKTYKRYTVEEDAIILAEQEKGVKNYVDRVMILLPHRTRRSIYRHSHMKNLGYCQSEKRYSTWRPEEDIVLKSERAISYFGWVDKVKDKLPWRTKSAIKSRVQQLRKLGRL